MQLSFFTLFLSVLNNEISTISGIFTSSDNKSIIDFVTLHPSLNDLESSKSSSLVSIPVREPRIDEFFSTVRVWLHF